MDDHGPFATGHVPRGVQPIHHALSRPKGSRLLLPSDPLAGRLARSGLAERGCGFRPHDTVMVPVMNPDSIIVGQKVTHIQVNCPVLLR